jgi:hypothetical protein
MCIPINSDKVGVAVREKLGKTEEQMPLAKVLQGGTWAAGRIIAKQLRYKMLLCLFASSDPLKFSAFHLLL